VFRIARNHCGDDDAALDITQQTFISAFAALSRYDRAHWLARIALNKCHDWARRRKVRAFLTFARPIDEAVQIAAPQVAADEQLADRQELDRAMAAIARLPDRLKEVLVLRTIEV
jgi:RNA polymerase sigma-70 factor (ECF subfamily)